MAAAEFKSQFCRCALFLWGVLSPWLPGAGAAAPGTRPEGPLTATQSAASRPAIAKFQPGIRIDWGQRQIEVDVTVILRDGQIELFACSPKNREHEAIVRIEAVPTHLFQALGLIGLTPGRPMHWSEQGVIVPASGDALELDIAWLADGRLYREPIEAWMKRAEDDRPLGRLPWVFAGSLVSDGGRLASDSEGTVVAVVDFPTSLIALAEHHTDSNDELWLRPNTDRIPVIGTACTLMIRSAPIRLRLEGGGRLLLNEQPVTRAELSRLIKARIQEQAQLRVELTIDGTTDPLEERSLRALLKSLNIREDALSTSRRPPDERPIIRR